MSKPDIVIKYRGIDELRPYERNARTHSPEQVDQIVASINEFGWTNPIILDGASGILAGHGRLMAARKLGLKEVPTVDLVGLTETQKRAYVLADNKLALNAGWDMELLKVELLDLDHQNFDLGLIGFHEDELANIFAPTFDDEDVARAEETPEPPVNPVTVLGDVWILGNHRIVCGDSTKADDVAKALNGVKPHLMVTDPPYGVKYDPKWRAEAGVNKNTEKLGVVLNDDRADWREAWALFPGDVAYVWHAGLFAGVVADSLTACEFKLRSQIIWSKDRFALSRGDYHWQHEPCWYAVREKATGHWAGDRKQATLWSIPAREDGGVGHGTQKPIECMKRPIENNSSPGQAVYEPFSGSGTTIMAGELTGRSIHAIELSPAYVDVAIKRWETFTGKKATLEATGQTFEEVCTARYEGGEWAKNTAGSYDEGVKAIRKKKQAEAAE